MQKLWSRLRKHSTNLNKEEACDLMRVFILSSLEDKAFVARLRHDLLRQAETQTVIIDEVTHLGSPIINETLEAIDSSDAVIIVLSSNAKKDRRLNYEISFALAAASSDPPKPIIPVLAEHDAYIPPLLEYFKHADLSPGSYEKGIRQLVDYLSSPVTPQRPNDDIIQVAHNNIVRQSKTLNFRMEEIGAPSRREAKIYNLGILISPVLVGIVLIFAFFLISSISPVSSPIFGLFPTTLVLYFSALLGSITITIIVILLLVKRGTL